MIQTAIPDHQSCPGPFSPTACGRSRKAIPTRKSIVSPPARQTEEERVATTPKKKSKSSKPRRKKEVVAHE